MVGSILVHRSLSFCSELFLCPGSPVFTLLKWAQQRMEPSVEVPVQVVRVRIEKNTLSGPHQPVER